MTRYVFQIYKRVDFITVLGSADAGRLNILVILSKSDLIT